MGLLQKVTDYMMKCMVSAPPIFQTLNDQPHDVNASVGDNVVIKCNAYANPSASIKWFKNGNEIQSKNSAYLNNF